MTFPTEFRLYPTRIGASIEEVRKSGQDTTDCRHRGGYICRVKFNTVAEMAIYLDVGQLQTELPVQFDAGRRERKIMLENQQGRSAMQYRRTFGQTPDATALLRLLVRASRCSAGPESVKPRRDRADRG
ncbi:MAG: hypothetical protein B7X79_01215 [Acidovorax sp. 17-64-282]|nr:MAG: hypothetical protein B7Y64_16450 [Acidovorax sp. 35-64-16]OYY84054.1 MAG: hypothetical protein B7Y46_13395 [Acidovorax sp. 28-64-14]OYZ45046.1 MAG: hypothetical protein B7Y20_08575 [Acidovorax sp. 16-64-162]OYZ67635.1 MAG: hypothetical protein B7Y14_14125 [Acidovorax sp. 24-64-9]OZA58712.1 MAG: hypothetical protein B7X79_01215 [Acidovorax sp. 17-64-282]OZA67164.1 MAG: hypothetical protein B7X70_18170 [Acidovorax sp. 39-64-12]